MKRLSEVEKDVTQAVDLLWETASVVDRFDDTGAVSQEQARELGWVGPAARSCGVETDVRFNHPFGPYRFVVVPVSTAHAGDVHSRAFVRWLEIKRSIQFVRERLMNLPSPEKEKTMGKIPPGRLAVSLTEGWRGEVCHVALTGKDGQFIRYKITDPSFHNWSALALSMRNQAISDFPLCNKSFNLVLLRPRPMKINSKTNTIKTAHQGCVHRKEAVKTIRFKDFSLLQVEIFWTILGFPFSLFCLSWVLVSLLWLWVLVFPGGK